MSRIEIAGASPRLREWIDRIWDHLGWGSEVHVVLATAERLADLNERFRGKEGATDVLTFPLDDERLLGEIWIAPALCPPGEDEDLWALDRAIHGLLHLDGCHHRDEEEEEENLRRHESLRAVALR